ncbi:MAG: potassium channel family protein [Mycobacteriaceae bacterium]
MTATPFSELGAPVRRRLLAASMLRVVGINVLLVVLLYLLPLKDLGRVGTLVFFVAGLAVFCVATGWQVRSIVAADYPRLRAIEGIGTALALLVVVFAAVYAAMSDASPASFSGVLTRSSSLYFTITTLSTTGFGDIVPTTDTARLVVSVQMLLDLTLLGTVVRVLAGAARDRSTPTPTPGQ